MKIEKDIITKNITYLVIIQLANFILPFLITPYLIRTLSASLYGVIAFGMAMVQIACVFTDYGFNLSATYSISKERSNKKETNSIIGAVYCCKILLLLFVLCGLTIYIKNQDNYYQYNSYLYVMLLSVVGQTLQPIWFFQGIEKLKYFSIITVLSKILYFFIIIFFVKSESDLILIAEANGLAYLFVAAAGVVVMIRLSYWPTWPGIILIKKTFLYSTQYFLSRAALTSYTSGGVFFLGLFSNPLQVSYYSCAEQMYKGSQALFSPISQALYPYMVKERNFFLFIKILKWSVIISIVGAIIGLYIGPWVIEIVYGSSLKGSYSILKVFIFVFIVTTPSILLGYPLLGAIGKNNLVNQSVIYAGMLQVILLWGCYIFEFKSGLHISSTILIVELFVLIIRIVWVKKTILRRSVGVM